MTQKNSRPVLPIYLAAAVWPLYALFLPLYEPAHYVGAAVLSRLVGVAAASLCRAPQSNPAVQQPQEAEKKEPEPNTPLQAMLADGEKALREMRRLNDNIKDEKISAAIDQLETISAKIFARVEEDPDRLPQIRRFMDYYLPTTLKLLNAYDRMGSQGISGENIDSSMDKVERIMDTIVTAFARQLDSLFGAEALDISTDITVLENMLVREGLAQSPNPADSSAKSGGEQIHLDL